MILRFLFCNAAFSSSPLIFCLNSAAVAVVCSDSCRWYIRSSKTGNEGVPDIAWGWAWPGMNRNHTIVIGDFDGDGKTDRAIVDKSNKKWFIYSSKNGPYESLVLNKKNTTKKLSLYETLRIRDSFLMYLFIC